MKKHLLWLVLFATLIATYFSPKPEETIISPPSKKNVVADPSFQKVALTIKQPPSTESKYTNLQIRPRLVEEDLANIFSSQTWKPALPKIVAKPPPPPPPEAPPLPFRFLGRIVEDGKTSFFLQFNDRNLIMNVGDSVDGTYKLESSNAGTLTFAYVPLDIKQTLAVGEVE